ncbi:MAG TPA: TPM domain-containing protein [Pyrinomonadaceae bacterium]
MKKLAIIAVLLTLGLGCVRHNTSEPSASTPVTSSTPRAEFSYVTDHANVIDGATKTKLEARLAELRQKEDIDFAVVTVSTSGAESAFDHSLKLARERGAAIKNQNTNGNLLLLVAIDDRNWHIQISRNLEAELTNPILTELSSPMTELFKQKRYGEGVTKYVDAIIAKLAELR